MVIGRWQELWAICMNIWIGKEAERDAPGLPSYTWTSQPCFASDRAARQPTGPPPTTTAVRRRVSVPMGISLVLMLRPPETDIRGVQGSYMLWDCLRSNAEW